VQIKNAVEEQFGVTVNAVNTSIRPGKAKARVVKGRHTKGRTSSIKKAIVTIAEGEYIEGFFGESDMDEIELIDDKEEANA
jgi:large subunit ribosomal protein L23